LPDRSIAESGTLADIATEYGYTSNYVGLVDVQRLVNTFTGDASGTDAALLALMQDDSPELSDMCKTEIRELAGVAPRIVMGYKSIDENGADTQAVIELRDDIGEKIEMAGLADNNLTIRMPEVADQVRAAPRVVDADDRSAA